MSVNDRILLQYSTCMDYNSGIQGYAVDQLANQVRCCADESCALLHSLEGYTILIAQLSFLSDERRV